MNENETNITPSEESSGNSGNSQPKPLRKLVRVNRNAVRSNVQQPGVQHSGNSVQPQYQGQHEAETLPPPPVSHYRGRYEAVQPAETEQASQEMYEERQAPQYYEPDDSTVIPQGSLTAVKPKKSHKDAIMKTVSIAASLVVIFVLILNMPILAYTKRGEAVTGSIISFIKDWQPLVGVEGELSQNSMELNLNSDFDNDDFTDGLDLPQIIEGQYTVMFLGMDESGNLTDVNWILEFDIAAAKLNILQIPRDSFMANYTNSSTAKFNSIYALGDQSISPIQRVANAVQDNFGIPIDAYITTHCYDIVSIVDLVGGIPIELDEEIVYEPGKIIPAGKSVLNGTMSEWFVRYRHGFSEGDIGRVKNQRKFLAAAMQKMLDIVNDEGRPKLYSYLNEIYKNQYILTDMSLDDISKLADFGSTLSMENVQVNMVPGEGAWYYPSGVVDKASAQSVWSIHKSSTIKILNEYFRPYQNDMTEYDSAIVELVSEENYGTTGYEDTVDNLQDLQNGAKPGENKTGN